MKTMYVEIANGYVLDVTNLKETPIHFNVKYIIGADYVMFTSSRDGVEVSRYKGTINLYTHTFKGNGRYMISPLFVDECIKVSAHVKDLYDYLKKNFTSFYLEEDYTTNEPYQITFQAWVDITLVHKYSIKVNPDKLNKAINKEILDVMFDTKSLDLLKLYKILGTRSIFIDRRAIEQMKNIGELFSEAN